MQSLMTSVFGLAYLPARFILKSSKGNAHLVVLAHIRGNLDARAEYIKRLPADKLNEVPEIIMKMEL